MCRLLKSLVPTLIGSALLLTACTQEAPKPPGTGPAVQSRSSASGEELFNRYCSSCHPNGGNVSDPDRPLFASSLKRNHLNTSDDIVRVMRHPISRMIRFDRTTLSDSDAQAIADYVLTSFK